MQLQIVSDHSKSPWLMLLCSQVLSKHWDKHIRKYSKIFEMPQDEERLCVWRKALNRGRSLEGETFAVYTHF